MEEVAAAFLLPQVVYPDNHKTRLYTTRLHKGESSVTNSDSCVTTILLFQPDRSIDQSINLCPPTGGSRKEN